MFLDWFFNGTWAPAAEQPETAGGAILRFHDTACEGIVRAVTAAGGVLAAAVAASQGVDEHTEPDRESAGSELWPADNPELPHLVHLLLRSDAARQSALVRAASVAEFLEVVDEVLHAFGGLTLGQPGTADAHRTAASLAPVLVHEAGGPDRVAGELLGAGVQEKLAALAAAVERAGTDLFQPFFQVVLAWKTDPARRLLAPPDREGAVRDPFTSLARAAVVAGGPPGTLAAALRTNLLVIEAVEKSDEQMSPPEQRYLLGKAQRYADLERDTLAARRRLLSARFAAGRSGAEHRGPEAAVGKAPPAAIVLRPELVHAILTACAALSVLDRKVTADEIWAVLDALQPLGIDIKELHDEFVAACRSVHAEGVDQAAPGIAADLGTAFARQGGDDTLRRWLWGGLTRVAASGADTHDRQRQLLRQLAQALGLAEPR